MRTCFFCHEGRLNNHEPGGKDCEDHYRIFHTREGERSAGKGVKSSDLGDLRNARVYNLFREKKRLTIPQIADTMQERWGDWMSLRVAQRVAKRLQGQGKIRTLPRDRLKRNEATVWEVVSA